MRRILVNWSAMPPRIVTAPPERPVPAPRGTTGIRFLAATLTTPATCSVDDGRTTASGTAPSIEPSRSKIRSSARTESGTTLEDLETPGRRARKARGFRGHGADDQQVQPALAFLVGGHPVGALEDRLLDSRVRRHLDRVPHGKAVVGHGMMRLVDLPIDRQAHRLCLRGGAQSFGLRRDVGHKVQLKLHSMTGRKRVEAALAMSVTDRPPVGAWGHTYREEWSPEELAGITVERARRFGWDYVKFQPRASSFAEAFGSVYHPSGHRLRGPILIRPAVPNLDAWSSVAVANRKALDDQVDSIRLVARELGPDVPVIQTVFSPVTVGGYLV